MIYYNKSSFGYAIEKKIFLPFIYLLFIIYNTCFLLAKVRFLMYNDANASLCRGFAYALWALAGEAANESKHTANYNMLKGKRGYDETVF